MIFVSSDHAAPELCLQALVYFPQQQRPMMVSGLSISQVNFSAISICLSYFLLTC